MAKYVIEQTSNENYWFVLINENGQGMLTSRLYKSKTKAINGIISAQINSSNYDCIKKNISHDGFFYFTLHTSEGLIIGASKSYKTPWDCDDGIQSMKGCSHTTVVEDMTFDLA